MSAIFNIPKETIPSDTNSLLIRKNNYSPYAISLWLEQHIQTLSQMICNPLQTWCIQREIKLLMTENIFPNKNDALEHRLVCASTGGEKDSTLFFPKFEFITAHQHSIYPSYQGVSFISEEAIDHIKACPLHFNSAILLAFFQFLKDAPIPWEHHSGGCDGRADLTQQLLIAMGVPPDHISKHYCYGDYKLGEKLNQEWRYHVAIAVKDERGKQWILDPAVNSDKPMEVSQWREAILPKKILSQVIVQFSSLPLDSQEDTIYHIEVPSDCFLGKDVQRVIQVKKNYGFIGLVASHCIHKIIQKNCAFESVAGYYYEEGTQLFRTQEQENHDIGLKKLKSFLGEKEGAPCPTPEDIKNLLFVEWIRDEIQPLLEDQSENPQDYADDYVARRIPVLLAQSKRELNADITLLDDCLTRMKQQGYAENDILIMQQTINCKKTELQEEWNNYQKRYTTTAST